MVATILRFARVLLGQAIGALIIKYGGIEIPYVGLTIGAAVSAIFKFLRDKYPNNAILTWLPL